MEQFWIWHANERRWSFDWPAVGTLTGDEIAREACGRGLTADEMAEEQMSILRDNGFDPNEADRSIMASDLGRRIDDASEQPTRRRGRAARVPPWA